MTSIFAWVLIVALVDPQVGTVVQVKVPMLDEAACEAARQEMRVTRKWGRSIEWLDSLCVPAETYPS